MKYIRTKDGKIYDSLALRIDEFDYLDKKGLPHKEYRIADPLKKVLKIADTIEELCDEFVLKAGNKENVNKNAYTMLEYYPKLNQMLIHPRHRFEVFGAMWRN